jgi:mRNA interferase MazF
MVRRGEVWWAALGTPDGAAPGWRRPVLVIQSDRCNRSRIATVVVAALTSNLRLAEAPGNVSLPEGTVGLPKASVVNVSQIATVDNSALTERSGTLDAKTIDAVDDGLRMVLEM